MMYREFVDATGCKMTDKNFQIFKGLEILYMNSDISKNEIYQMGKKLVDNSKTEQEKAIEQDFNCKIAELEDKIEMEKFDIERHEIIMTVDNSPIWKQSIKISKGRIREYEMKIKVLKELAA